MVGSLVDGVFSGRISLAPGDDDGDFYVERAGPYLSSTSSSLFHSLIYAAKDVSFDGAGCGVHRHARDVPVGARRRHGRESAPPTNLRRARRSVTAAELAPQVSQAPDANALGNTSEDSGASQRLSRRRTADEHPQGDAGGRQGKSVQRVCNIELSVDHTFYEMVSSDMYGDTTKIQADITSLVHTHVASATEIFGNTNFNGITDISFVVQRLQINDSSACDGKVRRSNPYCADTLDATHTLVELSKTDHNNFCLSYLWTYRDFPGGTLGLAYVAELNGNAGGLCEKFQSDVALQLTSDYTGRVSLNTGVVTFVNKNVRVPHRISEVTFAHELGHNFGAQHDPPECVPGGSVGNFLMFATASHGTMPNNRRFSVCSIRDISAVLAQMFYEQGSRPNCLQVSDSVCMEACHFKRMKDFCNKKMEPGAPCDDLRGYCDVFQRCRLVEAEGALARLHWLVFGGRGLRNVMAEYWYFTLLSVVLGSGATALFIKLCAVHTPSSNPHLKGPRKIFGTMRRPTSLLRTALSPGATSQL